MLNIAKTVISLTIITLRQQAQIIINVITVELKVMKKTTPAAE